MCIRESVRKAVSSSSFFFVFLFSLLLLLHLLLLLLLVSFTALVGGKKITSMLTYLGEQMSVVLRNKNPLTKRLTSERHLLDVDMYAREVMEDTIYYS